MRIGLAKIMVMIILMHPVIAQSAILKVGPEHTLKKPSDAAQIAKDDDVIQIEGNTYHGDTAIFTQNNLLIRGVNGKPVLIAPENIPNRKAIWVIRGDNIKISNIEFRNAKVPDRNGSGIRQEKGHLVIENCHFENNEMAIVTSNDAAGSLIIHNSQIKNNIVDYPKYKRLGHNIYVGRNKYFELKNSQISGARWGHNVKSRAAQSVIEENVIYDGEGGFSSYLLDLPNGGQAIVRNNVFHQNSKTQNTTMISFGAEKNLHPANDIRISHNQFINDKSNGILLNNHTEANPTFHDNSISGSQKLNIQQPFWPTFILKLRKRMPDLADKFSNILLDK